MPNNNNNMRARTYTLDYHGALDTVFGVRRHFVDAFQPLQTFNGIRENETAFVLKTNNTPVVLGKTYNKGANVAFGTGTANSSRFGERTEIIYENTEAKYTGELVIHEGLDITTVNNDLDAAVLDRLYLQAEAQTRELNERHGAFLSAAAGNSETLDTYGAEDILALFNGVSTYNTNQEIVVPVTSYVEPDLYNAIVDHPLVNSGKGSAVNIDKNGILEFKDFKIVKTPARYFADGDVAYFVPNGVAIPFVGIQIARTIESELFAGLALQAFAKTGEFVLDDNKPAITKVTKAAISG